jgi:predicted ATPase
MLKRVTLENFFSFGEPTTIELNPGVNLLVGINGSGKSNFLKAIRLLHEAIAGKGFEKTFLQEWGGFGNVANVSGGTKDYIKLSYVMTQGSFEDEEGKIELDWDDDSLDVTYIIVVHKLGSTGYYFDELLISGPESNSTTFIEVENNRGKLILLKDIDSKRGELINYPNEGVRHSFSESELILRQIGLNINLYSDLKEKIGELLTYDYFNTASNSIIRQPSIFGTEEKLLPTGENLNSIIQKLKNNYSLDYEKIEDLLGDINPNFKDITFNLFGSKSYLLLREKNLANAISIEHLSDGTLRYLLLLAIFYNPNRGKGICIDEPETGLHPDMINTIAASIKHASKDTQFFIATHSPLLLNAFDLDDVLIFEKDKENQTKVEYKSEDDFEDWDENSLVGQLWLNGQLGGKRW